MSQIVPIILHLDVDAFFASVEQRDNARLRGKPIAVGTGVVASCSYESRTWGVRTGMRLSDARRMCAELIVLPGDYRRYEQVGRRILAICQEHTPRVEVTALDDLYLDLTQPHRDEGETLDHGMSVAKAIQAQVAGEVGMSVSLGGGISKVVAQVATQDAKEQRLKRLVNASRQTSIPLSPVVMVTAGSERIYLAPWPVETLAGVGPKVHARLEQLNVRTVGELADMPLAILCGLFGQRGKVLRDLARGIDPRPVDPFRPPRSVSRCTSFDPPSGDVPFLLAMLEHLAERASSWLRLQGLVARGMSLTIRYGDHASTDGRATFRPSTHDDIPIKEALRDCFHRLYRRRLPLRLVGLDLSPLTAAVTQPELFNSGDRERQSRLADCKDAVRQRFGFMALQSGSALVLARDLDRDRDNYHLRTPCLTR